MDRSLINNIKEKNIVGVGRQVKQAMADQALTQLADYKIGLANSMGVPVNETVVSDEGSTFGLVTPYGDAGPKAPEGKKTDAEVVAATAFDTDLKFGDKKKSSEKVKESFRAKYRKE